MDLGLLSFAPSFVPSFLGVALVSQLIRPSSCYGLGCLGLRLPFWCFSWNNFLRFESFKFLLRRIRDVLLFFLSFRLARLATFSPLREFLQDLFLLAYLPRWCDIRSDVPFSLLFLSRSSPVCEDLLPKGRAVPLWRILDARP